MHRLQLANLLNMVTISILANQSAMATILFCWPGLGGPLDMEICQFQQSCEPIHLLPCSLQPERLGGHLAIHQFDMINNTNCDQFFR